MTAGASSLEELQSLRVRLELVGTRQHGRGIRQPGGPGVRLHGVLAFVRGYGAQVRDQRGRILRVQKLQAVRNGLAHRTGRGVMTGA